MTIGLIGALLCGASLIVLATATTAVAQSRQSTTPQQTQRGGVYHIPGTDTFLNAQGSDKKTKKPTCVVKRVKEEGMPVQYIRICS